MGGFGSEYDLEKAGYTSVEEDSLSYEERLKMVGESGYLEYDLEEEENKIKNDKDAEQVNEASLDVKDSVFPVLDTNNPKQWKRKGEIKKRAKNIKKTP